MSNQSRGYIYVLLSATFYGSLSLFVKLAYQQGLSTGQTLLVRYILATIILAGILYARKSANKLAWGKTQLVQNLTYVMGSICYLTSLYSLSASVATLIFFSFPIVVVLLSILVDKRKYPGIFYVAMGISILGLILVVDIPQCLSMTMSIKGIIYALLSAMFWGIYSYLSERTMFSARSSLSVALSIMLTSTVVLALFYMKDIPTLIALTPVQYLIGFILALINTVLGVVLFLRGVTYLGSAKASLIAILEPVFALILAAVFLNEVLPWYKVLGALMLFAGVIVTRLMERKRTVKLVRNLGDL